MWPATQWETEKKTFPSRCHGEDVRSCWFILSKTRAYVRSCSSACLDPLVTHEPDVLTPKPPKPFLTDSQKVNILVQHSAYILVCILFCFFFSQHYSCALQLWKGTFTSSFIWMRHISDFYTVNEADTNRGSPPVLSPLFICSLLYIHL